MKLMVKWGKGRKREKTVTSNKILQVLFPPLLLLLLHLGTEVHTQNTLNFSESTRETPKVCRVERCVHLF